MANLAQFSQNIRKIGSGIENESVALVKQVAKSSLRELVQSTPVDTGKARSNWRVSLVNRTFAVIEPYFPGKHLGIGEIQNANATIAVGNAVINQLRAGPSRRGAGSAVYITNNVEYIDDLNRGTSKQVASQFIERALAVARKEIRNFRFIKR